MSKRHFEALAEKFRVSKPLVPEGADRAALTAQELLARIALLRQWHIDVVNVADVCASSPSFNRPRFYSACGVKD